MGRCDHSWGHSGRPRPHRPVASLAPRGLSVGHVVHVGVDGAEVSDRVKARRRHPVNRMGVEMMVWVGSPAGGGEVGVGGVVHHRTARGQAVHGGGARGRAPHVRVVAVDPDPRDPIPSLRISSTDFSTDDVDVTGWWTFMGWRPCTGKIFHLASKLIYEVS